MPVFKSFDIDDELQKVPVELKPEGYVTFNKFTQGDYQALKLIVPSGGYYYIKSTQQANILIYKDGEIFNNTITPAELKGCTMVGLDSGTYYAIIYNTVYDNNNTDDNISIKLSHNPISDVVTSTTSINTNEPYIWVSGNTICINCQSECNINVYKINGTIIKNLKASTGLTEIKGLASGTYIINGKKILIK